MLAEVGASDDDFNPQMGSEAVGSDRERLGDEAFDQLFRERAGSGAD